MKYVIAMEEMREFDRRASRIIPEMILMENAGRLVAEHLLRDLRALNVKSLVILAGPGHNGGDGIVAARHLNDNNLAVTIFLTSSNLKPLTRSMLETLDKSMSSVCFLAEAGGAGAGYDELIGLLKETEPQHAFLDAFLGSGINRPLDGGGGGLPELMEAWNRSGALRYAVDLPSGIGAGADGGNWPVFQADYTLAIQFPRSVLYTGHLREHCGEIRCLDIGFPAALLREYVADPRQYGMLPLLEERDLPQIIRPVPEDAHKGTRGRVEVFAGSPGMAGAALLTARAALHSGAGLVRLASSDTDLLRMVLEQEPALMTAITDKEEVPGDWGDCILAGPGWGKQPETLTSSLIKSDRPLVMDADALPALKLCASPGFQKVLEQRKAPVILTPHPGEAAILLDEDTTAILRHPYKSVRDIAGRYHAWVVLKSSVSYISDPDGGVSIYDGRLPALGTAGSGDVLAGIIAGLLARGLDPGSAAAGAVLLHAGAGRRAFLAHGWFSAQQLLASLSAFAGEIQYRQSDQRDNINRGNINRGK